MGKVLNQYKVAKHFELDIAPDALCFTRNAQSIATEARGVIERIRFVACNGSLSSLGFERVLVRKIEYTADGPCGAYRAVAPNR